MSHHVTRPEILSPAGHWPQLHAAIEAGADAVYFGLTHFTARAKVGFSLAELPEAMRTLHRRGVKGYVTFNTLVFDHELQDAARGLAAIAEAGADAIIVQDLAVVKLAREIAPELEIHGSTQMSVTSAEGVRLAQSLGASRVMLARELSLDEIRAIRAATDCESRNFRSRRAVRGLFRPVLLLGSLGRAQRQPRPVRAGLPAALRTDGGRRGSSRWATRATCSRPAICTRCGRFRKSSQIGISGAEDRGPLQGRRLRRADHAGLSQGGGRGLRRRPLSVTRGRRGCSSNRCIRAGSGPYFLTGTNHQAVVKGRAPRHRGVLMGTRGAGRPDRRRDRARSGAAEPLKPGDGVVFDAADWRSPQEPEEGGRVYEWSGAAARWSCASATASSNSARIRPGDLVWRTHDPGIDKALRALPAHRAAGACARRSRARASRCASNWTRRRIRSRDRLAGAASSRAESRRSRKSISPRSSAAWAIRRTSWRESN